jgi:hypothetical protein
MKIREGHVSNSSSSSFLLVVTEDVFKKALKEASPLVKDIVKYLEPEKRRVFGKKVVIITTQDCHGEGTIFNMIQNGDVKVDVPKKEDDESGEYADDADYIKREIADNAWNDFVAKLEKNKDDVFTHTESY